MGILYNKNKWVDIYKNPKYQTVRDKITNAFDKLVFVEKGHKYYLDNKEMISVSNITHKFQEPFDSVKLATETYERNFNNMNSKYYQMSVKEIMDSWKKISNDSCSHGTEIHSFGENAFYFMIGDYDKITPDFKERITSDGGFKSISPKEDAIVKFYEDIPKCIIPIMTETKVFAEYGNSGYAGTFDILFYYDAELDNKSDKYSGLIIMDYKTNKDLFKNFKEKKLLSPFNYMLDMPLSLYKLQLSLYENALYKIGMTIVGRRIIWLKPDGVYEKFNIDTCRSEIDNSLKSFFMVNNK